MLHIFWPAIACLALFVVTVMVLILKFGHKCQNTGTAKSREFDHRLHSSKKLQTSLPVVTERSTVSLNYYDTEDYQDEFYAKQYSGGSQTAFTTAHEEAV